MATKTIKNIQTTLSGEGIGSLVVIWDMVVESDIPANRHDDDHSGFEEESRQVEKIRSVEFQVYDCVGVDLTNKILESKRLTGKLEDDLLMEVENKSTDELTGVDMVRFANSICGY